MICSEEKEVKYLNISHATGRNQQRRLGEISRCDSRRNMQRRLGEINGGGWRYLRWFGAILGGLALFGAAWCYLRRLGLLFAAAWFTTICFDFFMNVN